MDMPHLPGQSTEQNWSPTANPEPGLWNPAKLSQDFRGGNPLHMVGGTSAQEGHGPFDDYGPGGTPSNSQWETGSI